MDALAFDNLVRTLTKSRRAALGGALMLAAASIGLVEVAAGKLPRNQSRRKPTRPNAFGCLDVGDPCRRAGQCCSGICKGKPGKKTCRGHNRGGCAPKADSCRAEERCGPKGGDDLCFQTTGNASFCGVRGGTCVDCARDADCEPTHGRGAACVVCAECTVAESPKKTACFAAAV